MNKNFILCFLLIMIGVFEISGIAAQDMAPPGSNGDIDWGKPDLAAPDSSGSWESTNLASTWGKQDLLPAGSYGNTDHWGKTDLQAPGAGSGQGFTADHKN